MELSVESLLNNWKNRKDEFKKSFVKPKDEYIGALHLGEAVGDRDLEPRFEALLSLLANYGLVDIPDPVLNKIVELIKQIWKRQAVLGMTAGVAYIHSLVEDLRLIRAKNDAEAIFGEDSDLVLLYSLMDLLNRRRHEAGKVFSAIQKYDWKMKIGPLLIALAQFLPVSRLEELIDFATNKDLISAKDLADLYLVVYKRTSDATFLRRAFRVYLDVDEEKALEVFKELLSVSDDLRDVYGELESVKSPARFNLFVALITEAVKRKDFDFAKEVLLEREGHALTVKHAQALGRELGSKFPKAALELLKELPGENGLYALLGILSGTKDLDVAIATMEHVLERLKTYSGDTLLILKQLIAVSIKLDIWDELILSVPENAPWLGDFENIMSDALKVVQGSADTEIRLENLGTPISALILQRMKSGGTRVNEWFDPTWFSDED
ncbi:MAG TPA: hypothetical protein GX508_03795 [Coprothermobacter sp.]|mgnify:CR=1 FL=1|nr:hypothetical protein [Coprothermobacter sp.]